MKNILKSSMIAFAIITLSTAAFAGNGKNKTKAKKKAECCKVAAECCTPVSECCKK